MLSIAIGIVSSEYDISQSLLPKDVITKHTILRQTGLSKQCRPRSDAMASDQDLHCLPFIKQFLDTTAGSTMDVFKF